MATPEDERALLEIWNPVDLESHLGKWIAFEVGKEIVSNVDLNALFRNYQSRIDEGSAPIFAFVDFTRRI